MKKALIATPLLILLTACGSSAGTAKSSTTTDPTRTLPPIERQRRTLACGATIAPPLAQSRDSDSVKIAIISAKLSPAAGIAVSYRITGRDPKTMLSLPIGEVPPTAILLKGGIIVATQPPATPGIDGGPALGYPVGQKPYEKTLTVDLPCQGTTFKDVKEHPEQYRAVVVMSVQNAGMPKDTKTPLVEVATVPQVTG
ncbi:hypothetical protein ACIHFE_29680 [Streptomyces sp. NPDC052396]|uniref:hypothetical protein n=1 Tax=Streptomyces sp. NPDC052396 TaxID=3365689 RepID=UPI0037D7E441